MALTGWFDTEAVEADAREAWEAGQRFYLCKARSFRSPDAVPRALEAIEDLGWRLEQMSHVWSTFGAGRSVGYYLFRRSE